MKTAIQEAISQLKEIRDEEMAAGWEGEAYAYDTAISILKDLLEKEKEQIMCAYDAYAGFAVWGLPTAEQYYNETFNADENENSTTKTD
jgi:hypothetical protein